VPGYHKFLETWAKQTPIFNKVGPGHYWVTWVCVFGSLIALYSQGSFVYVPKEDPLREHSQKITARKGIHHTNNTNLMHGRHMFVW
jgi:hypothetical protein